MNDGLQRIVIEGEWLMYESMPGYRQLIARYPMAGEWLGALENVRSRMRIAAYQSEATGSPDQRYFTEQPLDTAPPEPWHYIDTEGRKGEKPLSLVSVPLALVGAGGGAIVGAVLWAAAAFVFQATLPYLAFGIALLVGYGILIATEGRRGRVMQLIALVGTLAGFIVGKDLAVELAANASANGATVGGFYETIRGALAFSDTMVARMLETVQTNIGPIDLFVMVLALWTAWRITASSGVRCKAPQIAPAPAE